LLNELSDQVEKEYHKEEATRFYAEWGAAAKVEIIMDS
jgi:hypothetical protein